MHTSASCLSDCTTADASFPNATNATQVPLASHVSVRLARSRAEIEAAQRLRYEVFFCELGATSDARARAERSDMEAMDDLADHLIVVDHRLATINHGVVGTYRLLRSDRRPANRAFYSSGEFNIDRLLESRAKLLELGRSCVRRDYRQRPVLQLLWKALAAYVADHGIEIMFGCASFHGIDPTAIEQELAYLHYHQLADPALQPHAIGAGAISGRRVPAHMIETTRVLRRMPPLIRGYLQLGAKVGRDAFVDTQFNCIDVCIVLPTADLAVKYARHYERQGRVKLRQDQISQNG